jgi:DNA modification methylase
MSVRADRQGMLPGAGPSEKRQVECLGLTFESDEARREYFTEKLREKLRDPEFRKIEGFPIGEDEDILALSDPPYYTACPNPFLEDFIRHYGRPYDPAESYSREPFAADVSEGKNDPIYNAHSYHTKVPHKAIMRYILHYTEPGDVVFDGFCGTGMTGVAAQMCGDSATVESLGYRVKADGTILDEEGKEFSKLGARRAVLNDLSPAATFIAYNYNTPVDAGEFEREARRILDEVEAECGWMYLTPHQPKPEQLERALALLGEGRPEDLAARLKAQNIAVGRINYTVWSDVFICPECAGEVVFWEAAVDKQAGKVHDEFPCPHCNASLTKRRMERAFVSRFDKAMNRTVRQAKQVPVLINYVVGKKRFERNPIAFDLMLAQTLEGSDISYWIPSEILPKGFNTEQPKVSHGITHVHHFYTKRNLAVLGMLRARLKDSLMQSQLLCLVGDQLPRASKMHKIAISRLNTNLSKTAGVLAGTLYVPSNQIEYSVVEMIGYRIKDVASYLTLRDSTTRQTVATQSTDNISLSSSSVDYIFTDPPFGGNLMYSELNFLWEAWLKVFTNNEPEAIENSVQKKGMLEYQHLMLRCFREYYRVLKPGRWMTVEFHNSKNSVWNSIQEALQQAGFVVADVRTLDKKQGTIKQVTSGGTVKQDLIISAYKPDNLFEEKFRLKAGTRDGVWDFIRSHLQLLPSFVRKNGQAEVIAERQNYLLFDRMVAFHVERGYTIPLSAAEFYAGLAQQFPERDGMYFLPEQVAEYDRRRMTVKEMGQLELIPRDEDSAIKWLRQQLHSKPQTFQELQPNFMKIAGFSKHEKPLELSEILEQNFLRYEGQGDVPNQIHSYLSSNFKELRNLPKDNPSLRTKARDRWYVPDPNKAGDLEKLREKALLKEFAAYQASTQKKLKVFRLEAVRAGFQRAWQQRDYQTIIQIARKLPEAVLQEDPILLRFYDNALMRTGDAE